MAQRNIPVSAIAVPQEPIPHAEPVPIPHPAPKSKRRRVRSQRGSIVRRGRSWIAVFRTKEGKQKWQTFHSKAEATNCLNDALKLVRDGKYTDAEPELFSVYVKRWLALRAVSIKPNTHRVYATMLKKYLVPEFGEQEMRDITREQVRDFVERLLKAGKLSGRSIRTMLIQLHDVFDHAIEDKRAQNNPAHRLKINLPDDAKARYVPPPEDVSATFAELNANPNAQVFLALTALTGLRKGEALGLWWTDINFLENTIKVERTLTRANHATSGAFRNISWHYSKTLAVVPPKTKTSKRPVNMPAQLADLLRQLQTLRRTDSPFVFVRNDDGGPLDPEMLDDVLHAAQDRADVRHFGFHGLRHLFASRLQDAGASPAHTRDSLGHSSITMTDNYTHAVGNGRAFSDAVARVFPFQVRGLLEERTPARPSR
jgi:integrase